MLDDVLGAHNNAIGIHGILHGMEHMKTRDRRTINAFQPDTGAHRWM
jgi:hypothetical protein